MATPRERMKWGTQNEDGVLVFTVEFQKAHLKTVQRILNTLVRNKVGIEPIGDGWFRARLDSKRYPEETIRNLPNLFCNFSDRLPPP